jgi:transcriptional regulator with XRE-family HTH domain
MGRRLAVSIEQLTAEDPDLGPQLQAARDVLAGANLVRTMREQAGLSQEELALAVGVSQPRISKVEKGDGAEGITYGMLKKIARACGFEQSFARFERRVAAGGADADAVVMFDQELAGQGR